MDNNILTGINLLSQSITFGASVFSVFVSPTAIALYLFGFAIFTVNRILLRPLIGQASSDMARTISKDDKRSDQKNKGKNK